MFNEGTFWMILLGPMMGEISRNVAFSFQNSKFCKIFHCHSDGIGVVVTAFWLFCKFIRCHSDISSLIFPIYFTYVWFLFISHYPYLFYMPKTTFSDVSWIWKSFSWITLLDHKKKHVGYIAHAWKVTWGGRLYFKILPIKFCLLAQSTISIIKLFLEF